MTKKHYSIIMLGIVAIIMILTNPGKDDFTEYCQKESGRMGTIVYSYDNLGRDNYLIFSVHKAKHNAGGMSYDVKTTEKYLGVFGTFLKLSSKTEEVNY